MFRFVDGVLVWQRDPPRVEAHQSGDPSWVATYRWRDDDGDESDTGATFLAAADTPITVGPGQDVEFDTNVRIRIAVDEQNTGGGGDYSHGLRASINGGSFFSVTTFSSGLQVTDSPHLTNEQATTDHGFTIGSGAFVAGTVLDDSGSIGTRTIDQDDYTIHEWCFQFRSADLSDGDEITFKITTSGSDDTDDVPLTGTPATVSTASGTDVAATTANLTLTPLAATVNAETSVQVSTAALTLTEQAASVTLTSDTNVAASTAALTLTENAAVVNAATNVQTATAALMLTESAATVNAATNVQATTGALTLSTLAASVNAATNVQASTATLTLVEQAATVSATTNVQATTAPLSLTTFAADVGLTSDTNVAATTATLTLSTQAAVVNAAVNVQATVATLSVTSFAATIALDRTVQAGLASLVLTEQAATVNAATNVEASTASLTVTTLPATVALDLNVLAGTADLSLSEQAATIAAFGPPQNLTATPVSSSQIDLSWDAVSGATGYDIERDTVVVVLNHGTNSFSDTGLDGGVQFDYRVRALKETAA